MRILLVAKLLDQRAQHADHGDRAVLALGQTIAGPAIIEERETTVVLPPGWEARVDDIGCLVAKRRI